jgi:hypothetical protein
VKVGGVRTNFSMLDVFSIALGGWFFPSSFLCHNFILLFSFCFFLFLTGGSMVDLDNTIVGIKSVGYELTKRSLIFGGNTLTTTDI